MNPDGARELLCAVVLQAVEDYKDALCSFRRNPDSKKIKAGIKHLESFFRSQMPVNGEFIIKKTREKCGMA